MLGGDIFAGDLNSEAVLRFVVYLYGFFFLYN